MTVQFYLASRSARRVRLLRELGYRFECLPGDIAEVPQPGETPEAYALRLALAKARAAEAAAAAALPVLGADTDVSVDGQILGKPRDREDALRLLALLSARRHRVCSAVALVQRERAATALTCTEVEFGTIAPAAAARYWASGEPADKAGAYAIQGGAARWVRRIEGSYTGVVGLPLLETVELLAGFGIEPDEGRRQ